MNLIERGLSTAIVGVRTNFNNITNLKSSIEWLLTEVPYTTSKVGASLWLNSLKKKTKKLGNSLYHAKVTAITNEGFVDA